MDHIGQLLIGLGLVLTSATTVASFSGAITRRPGAIRAGYLGMKAVAWLNISISFVLLYVLVTNDFTNRYVASYTDASLPLMYVLTAFWGGEKGALLFWVVSLSGLGAVLARFRKDDVSPFMSWVVGVVAAGVLFFEILLLFASNPFEVFITFGGPADGNGLNPLLQNPLMAIHPPLQLIGFVAYTIPFAFVIGWLVKPDAGRSWVVEARQWNLFAWSMLTAGLIIGELWSYVELGWGGYWGWDPVENAALLPWLTGTALVHSMSVERRCGLLRRWNVFLAILTFILTIFATFLTRSQLIDSLHSFAESKLTPFFLYYMLFLVALGVVLFLWRWKKLAPARRIEHPLSREGLVVATILMFMLMLFIVLWGTLLPKFSESGEVRGFLNWMVGGFAQLTGGVATKFTAAVQVGPQWFNKVVGPVAIVVLGLSAIGPVARPGVSPKGPLARIIWISFGIGLIVAIAVTALAIGPRALESARVTGDSTFQAAWRVFRIWMPGSVYAFVIFVFSVAVIGVALGDWWRSVSARAHGGVSRWSAAIALIKAEPPRFVGHLIHIGVALSFIGFAGGVAKYEIKDRIVRPLDSVVLGDQTLTYLSTTEVWNESGAFAAIRSSILATQTGVGITELPKSWVAGWEGLESASGGGGALITLKFNTEQAALVAYMRAWVNGPLADDFEISQIDDGQRRVLLTPTSAQALAIVPEAFGRRVAELGAFAASFGDGSILAEARKAPFSATLTFGSDGLFDLFRDSIKKQTPRLLAFQPTLNDRDRFVVVPAGVIRPYTPEVRYYPLSESPTSEVALSAGLVNDLYLSAAPTRDARAVSLSAMENPMMTPLWVGGLMLVGFGLVAGAIGWRTHFRREIGEEGCQ